MKHPFTIAAVMIASFLISSLSCSHKLRRAEHQTADTASAVPPQLNPQPRSPQKSIISPNNCRLRGTVLETDHTDTLRAIPGVECRIRIDSVLGYGSSFGMPLSSGSTIHIRIASYRAADTLHPRAAESGTQYRISRGSILEGDVERNSVDENAGTGLNFTMYDVVIIK